MNVIERRCDRCDCLIPRGIEYIAIRADLDVLRDHETGTRLERYQKLSAEVCGTTCLLALVSVGKDTAVVAPLATVGTGA